MALLDRFADYLTNHSLFIVFQKKSILGPRTFLLDLDEDDTYYKQVFCEEGLLALQADVNIIADELSQRISGLILP